MLGSLYYYLLDIMERGQRVPPSMEAESTIPERTPLIEAPSRQDILKYRAHHGTNLGSCFVLEKWLTPSAFPPNSLSDQSSELAAVSLGVTKRGVHATKAAFENRWRTFLCDSDFEWLVNTAHCECESHCSCKLTP
jgi:hypothetical protein